MKNYLRKTAALFAAVLLCAVVSCGRDNEEINDSQESTTEENNTGKTEITVGMPGINKLVLPIITEFNSKYPDYNMTIVDYSKQVTDDDENGSKAVNQIKLDLVSGKAPDIVVLHPSYMAAIVGTGAFADMYDLMEQYDGVKKEDFLPNVIGGFEVNGEIPAISYCFTIDTAAAKTKFVGADKESWTPEEAMEAYSSMPEDMTFCEYYTETAVADFMMKKSVENSMDYACGTCNFVNDEFIKILDFCRDNSVKISFAPDFESMTEDEINMYFSEQANAVMNDRQLVSELFINGFDQTAGNIIWTDFGGEDITYVGFPSDNGIGAVTSTQWMFGISESCENKEAAWQFINYLFSDSFQKALNDTNDGLPVIRSVLDYHLENTDRNDYNTIYSSRLCSSYMSFDGEYIPEEAVQKLYDYILSVDFSPYTDFVVDGMIKEEYAAVIAGEKTGEECAEIIQNRVSIYLSEKS